MTDPAEELSDAIVLFLERFPGSNEQQFRSTITSEAVRDAVRSILDETMQIKIDWGHKSLSEIGHEVVDVMHERHPGLSQVALRKLGNYFTYLVK